MQSNLFMDNSPVQGTLLYMNFLFENTLDLKIIFQNRGRDKGTAMFCSVKIPN